MTRHVDAPGAREGERGEGRVDGVGLGAVHAAAGARRARGAALARAHAARQAGARLALRARAAPAAAPRLRPDAPAGQ